MATSVASEQLTAPRARVPRYTRFDFWLDIVLFVAFTLDFNLEFTGIPVHEWLGAAFGIALVVHLVSHWDWVVKTSKKVVGKHSAVTRSSTPSASSARPNRSCRRLQSSPQSRCSRNGVANSGLRLCEDHCRTPKGRPP